MPKKQEMDSWEVPEMKQKIQNLLTVDQKVREITDQIIELSYISRTASLGVCKCAETMVRAMIVHQLKFQNTKPSDNPEKKIDSKSPYWEINWGDGDIMRAKAHTLTELETKINNSGIFDMSMVNSIRALRPGTKSLACGNCGVFREIKDGMVEKCSNCGNDEFEMRWEDAKEAKL